ncbi:Ltp family lipoprotein [Paenibacillus sp. FA6]|uniref:Ltp family lipoprotein n=1 Tax=Paenibacillus sp. FA6 TaxID=3413029 RepID=UPI003F65E20A
MWMALGLLSFLACGVLITLGLVSLIKKKGTSKKMFLYSLVCFVLFIVAMVASPAAETETADAKDEVVSAKVDDTSTVKADDAAKQEADQAAKDKADQEAKDKAEAEAKVAAEELAKKEAEAKEESVPREHKSALKSAESYAETMHMSKAGIYDQLTSEYGEKFPPEAAQYAIDNIVFDWKENALKQARTYAETMSMSDSAVYDQLISEYGEKFTKEEAQYAIDNLE